MKSVSRFIFLLTFFIAINISCKRPYAPPAIQADNKFLVIDGALINSVDSPSTITLSRTIKLTDTINTFPETSANVSVEGNTGENFAFTEVANGVYKSSPLLLNYANKYRLNITTTNGNQYLSDYVDVRQTPAIDSITWQQQNDVTIYANTHDPANNTKYYRWDFVETWQYRSQLESELGVENGFIYYATGSKQIYNCWINENSSKILTGTSAALSRDEINKAPIDVIPKNSGKSGIRYSILVKQYAITEDAYRYLQILKTNTEDRGSIFDTQPTQLTGNIHSVNNPSEVVIGYITASSVQQQRIFINVKQLSDWVPVKTGRICDTIAIGQDPVNYLIYDYADPEYGPFFFAGCCAIALTRRSCLDCRLMGGTNQTPVFW